MSIQLHHSIPENQLKALIPQSQLITEPQGFISELTNPISNLFKKIASSTIQYWSSTPKSSSKEFNSTILPTQSVPQEFWETDAGKIILEITNLLQKNGILKEKNLETVKKELEECIYNESANTGETMANLILMSGQTIDTKVATLTLGLIQKISKSILERHDEISLNLKTKKFDLASTYKKTCAETAELLDKYVYHDKDEEANRLLTELALTHKNLLDTAQSTRAVIKEIYNKLAVCKQSYNAISAIETLLFQNKKIEFMHTETIQKNDQAERLAMQLAGSTEFRAIRCIATDSDHTAHETMSAVVDSDYKMFIPRIGTNRYAKAKEFQKAIETFLKNCIYNDHDVQVTLWKKQPTELKN